MQRARKEAKPKKNKNKKKCVRVSYDTGNVEVALNNIQNLHTRVMNKSQKAVIDEMANINDASGSIVWLSVPIFHFDALCEYVNDSWRPNEICIFTCC